MTIENKSSFDVLLTEDRLYPPSPSSRTGKCERPSRIRQSQRRPRGVLGRAGREPSLVQEVGHCPRVEPSVRQMVRRRQDQRLVQLPRPPPGTAGANKAAIIWEGEPGDARILTYQELHREVCKFANVLKGLGLKTGDRVTIYMPMVPELAIAMLACARIGARTASSSAASAPRPLADRINDAKAQGRHHRRRRLAARQVVPLKQNVDDALENVADRREVRRLQRAGNGSAVEMKAGRDLWWHELMADASRGLPGRGARQRAPALHPLHLRHDRQAQGHRAHHGRLPARRVR